MVVATSPVVVEDKEEPSTLVDEGPVFTLEILKIITDSQQQHGLRHSDFQRYRGYCTRRIRRLRKTLHLPQGDKRHFKRRDVTESHLKDERFLYIPLMLTERAWGYAMQLRQESNTEPRKRFHLVSKLKKAAAYAEQLDALCQSELCDARSKLEAQAYLSWIKGTLDFELKDWKLAMDNLQQAQMVYEKLSGLVDENDLPIYKGKCEDLVPSLRYCSYSIGDNSAMSDLKSLQGALQGDMLDTLDRLMVDARLKTSGSKREVIWRGKSIPVSLASVSSFLVAEEEMPQNIEEPSQANIDKIERHIINCKDAVGAVRDEINGVKSKSSLDGSLKSLQSLLSYLTHIRLSRSNQRTLLMIVKLSEDDDVKKGKPQDFIRSYELIIQNLTEMQNLPGLEEDDEYQTQLDSTIAAYKVFRCYYIAEALMAVKKFREALAIYQKSASYCSSVTIKTDNLSEKLEIIRAKAESAKSSCLARAVLQEADDNKTTQSSTSTSYGADRKQSFKIPLVDNLDVYSEDPKWASKNASIIRLPPDMKPIPAKPLYFDVAMNHLTFPSVEAIVDSKKGPKGAPGAIAGFVKGLWGWGGNK